MVGLRKKKGHIHKNLTKMVNPRDIAVNTEEEEQQQQYTVIVKQEPLPWGRETFAYFKNKNHTITTLRTTLSIIITSHISQCHVF